MLPERTRFNVVDKSNGREVHVGKTLVLDDQTFSNVAGLGGTFDRAFGGHRISFIDGAGELRRTKYVRHEGMIVQAPDAVGACRFEGVGQDEFPDDFEISDPVSW